MLSLYPSRRLLLAISIKVVLPLLAIPIIGIYLSLLLTPARSTTLPVVNQDVKVSATLSPGWSGPGRLIIGDQSMPILIGFAGPLRPKFEASHIRRLPSQSANFLKAVASDKTRKSFIETLKTAFRSYFRRQLALSAVFAAASILLWFGAWRLLCSVQRFEWLSGRLLKNKRLAFAVASAATLAMAAVTGATDYALIRADESSLAAIPGTVNSLDQLVGVETPTIQPAPGPKLRGYNIIVLGDSTAAGVGNPLVANPTRVDSLCGRSQDSFAEALALAGGYNALNLACSGATLRNGLFRSEYKDGTRVPSQLGVLRRVPLNSDAVIILNIGADDVQWQTEIGECIFTSCDDKATAAIFQSQLDQFNKGPLDFNYLLDRLVNWPGHPHILVNLYYNPLSSDVSCLANSPSIRQAAVVSPGEWKQRVKVLTSRLDEFNATLADTAKKAGVPTVQPNFTGHSVCSSQPYVQSVDSVAPLHPNSEGQQAIATADALSLLHFAGHTSSG